MKTNQLITQLLVGTLLMTLGCAKSSYNSGSGANGNGTAVVPSPVLPPIPGLTSFGATTTGNVLNPGSSGGDLVDFTAKDFATFESYVATHPLNRPSNIKIRMNLTQVGSGRYGGNVSISYIDNNIQYDGTFSSGSGMNYSHKDLRDNGKFESEYNYWFNYNNTTVFSGFFQDAFGALVVVISPDESTGTNLGDGQGSSSGKYAGHVYYKNFATSFAQQSPYRSCWFTYLGPYDCRSTVVATKCGLYPGVETGYKFLGSFKGLDLKKAFNYN